VPERDVLDVDVLIVGGGPAGLSAAIRLAQQAARSGPGTSLSIAVVEKARSAGAHSLSGAVLDISALAELLPDYMARGAPLGCAVSRDDVLLLTKRTHVRLPLTPPPLANQGSFVIALSTFVAWLARQAERAGVDVVTGFGASELLYEGDRVVGARMSDRGLKKTGAATAAFEPGPDIRSRLTILCDGVRGNLTKQLIARHRLDEGRLPQTYALGVKELWEVPSGRLDPGHVIHTLGFPLRLREFGGGFVYGLPDNKVSLGLVAGLDYEDAAFDPHARLQTLKAHPFVAGLLDGGTLVRAGAKALPEGGWHAIPRLHADGALMAGDAAGFVNSLRLKGLHLAMRSGMLAADAAFRALAENDVSAPSLAHFDRAVAEGPIRAELYPVRNIHQAFAGGLLAGLAFSAFSLATNGWWFTERLAATPGHRRMKRLDTRPAQAGPPAAAQVRTHAPLSFDKATSTHASGTTHREDAPSHLVVRDPSICTTRCTHEYGNPCTKFCPADVYEMVERDGAPQLHINASNCLHCKACDIIDPYQIVDWVPPEGGDGPSYEGM
jgi:electron-transferring-flavoprotein dehydrogenase